MTVVLGGMCVLAACGEPTATLTVQLQALPELTREQSITVQGTVTRSPSKETITVVAVAGGMNTVRDSLASPGSFSIPVTLNANQETQLAITASDAQGFVSEPVIVSILHDDVGPQIAQMNPASRTQNAALDSPIEVEFQEPLLAQAGAQVRLLHNGFDVPGNATISTDSLRVSFEPAAALVPASVYQLTFSGFTDGTGNPVDVDTQACFLTELSDFTTQLVADSTDPLYIQGQPESRLSPTDLERIRFSRADSTMYVLVEFADERTLDDGGDDNSVVYIEIDADQDPQTGFVTLKDSIFDDEFDAGIGADFIFGLETIPQLGDSAYVGLMTAPLEFDVLETFGVGICGRFWGFHHTSFLSTNGDDGQFDYTALGFTIGTQGNIVDPMPERGLLTVNVTGIGAAPGVYRDNIVLPRGPRRSGGSLHRYVRAMQKRDQP